MAEEPQPEKIWDEYDWERFLQQQDRKTERYMELLERYVDDPNRDQIIAREMGWTHLLNEDGERWMEAVDELFEEEMEEFIAQDSDDDDEESDGEDEDADVENRDEEDDEEGSFEVHPLYQLAFALTIWIDQLFEEKPELQNSNAAMKLSTNSAVASAKLAAALSDDDVDEIGMTIAYLKRALKAVTVSMDAAGQLRKEGSIDGDRFGQLNQRLFQIRDLIIELMGSYRAEFRRRYDV